jgi:hypothetical protein
MNPIKPPDGRPPIGPTGPGADSDVVGAERSGEAFHELLDGARPAGAPGTTGMGAAPAGAATGSDAIAALAQALRAGTITSEQAIDQLVQRAVAGMARDLSEAQRGELAVVLREALQNDPALRDLLG